MQQQTTPGLSWWKHSCIACVTVLKIQFCVRHMCQLSLFDSCPLFQNVKIRSSLQRVCHFLVELLLLSLHLTLVQTPSLHPCHRAATGTDWAQRWALCQLTLYWCSVHTCGTFNSLSFYASPSVWPFLSFIFNEPFFTLWIRKQLSGGAAVAWWLRTPTWIRKVLGLSPPATKLPLRCSKQSTIPNIASRLLKLPQGHL